VIKTSLKKLIEGGQDIFNAQAINQFSIKIGMYLFRLLIKLILRDLVFLYPMFII